MPIEMYGESRFMHFWVDIFIVLYIFGFGTARLGEWRLNHIHSINGAEVINPSCSDSSAEMDYSLVKQPVLFVNAHAHAERGRRKIQAGSQD